MTFEEFVKLFTQRGKQSIVHYPRYRDIRKDEGLVETQFCKSKVAQSLKGGCKDQFSKGSVPFTAEYKTDYIRPQSVLAAFTQVYIPEQLLLDDELERLRIDCISSLASEKVSLMALFR